MNISDEYSITKKKLQPYRYLASEIFVKRYQYHLWIIFVLGGIVFLMIQKCKILIWDI